MEKIILIDAYSQIFRCYYAMKASLTNSRGVPTNALYGIARLLMLLDKTQPSEFGAVCFDKGGSRRRKALLPEYKAQRAPMPENLRLQIEPIKEWMQAFGWTILEEEGVEADDLIAAVTNVREGRAVSIITHDKDIAQLITCPDILLMQSFAGGKWEETRREDVIAKFGVPPEQLRDYLALVGDTVDNIKGIDGIGPKTAASLLAEYGSLDGIAAHAAEIKKCKVRDSLCGCGGQLAMNCSLVSLDLDLPSAWHGMETIRRREPDWARLREMAVAEGFTSMLKGIDEAAGKARQPSLF